MIKVYVPNISNTSIGGGWTFLDNLRKAFEGDPDVQLVDSPDDYDILLGFGPTVIDGGTIAKAQSAGKPFILRTDGIPEDYRNSGRGTRRLYEYALKADRVIFQSNFIRDTVGSMLAMNGLQWAKTAVVKNGVDTDLFTPDGPKMNLPGELRIFHMNYRKDPNKRYEEVVQMYRYLWTVRKDVTLILLGRYPSSFQKYNFGFFNGERYKYLGIVEDDSYKAMVMRSCDVFFYPSYADPAPNAALEAVASGLPTIFNPVGGTREYVGNGGIALLPDQGIEFYRDTFYHLKKGDSTLKEFSALARAKGVERSLSVLNKDYKAVFREALKNVS